MNYISQIRAFYDLLAVKQLSTGQIALWHSLMDINNRCGWQEWFTVANMTLELGCSLSRRGIYDARNALKQAGLIAFKSNGTKAAAYHIKVLYIAQPASQAAAQGTAQAGAGFYKPKTKPKEYPQEGKKAFAPPQPGEVRAYCEQRGSRVDPEAFLAFYESKGWKVGREPMRDWRAAIRSWELREKREEAEPQRRVLR